MTTDRDDPGYWDALATRVTTAAVRSRDPGAFGWLAQSRAAWAVIFFLAAGAVTVVLISNVDSAREADWSAVLAPVDSVGRAMVLGDEPPAAAVLLLQSASGGNR